MQTCTCLIEGQTMANKEFLEFDFRWVSMQSKIDQFKLLTTPSGPRSTPMVLDIHPNVQILSHNFLAHQMVS